MQLVRPYIDENRQLIFIEFENETVQDVVNGALRAILVFGPISLVTPSLL